MKTFILIYTYMLIYIGLGLSRSLIKSKGNPEDNSEALLKNAVSSSILMTQRTIFMELNYPLGQ